jgi:hypothetical protein
MLMVRVECSLGLCNYIQYVCMAAMLRGNELGSGLYRQLP